MTKKMENKKHSDFIELPSFDTKNGILTMAQNLSTHGNGSLPFDIARVLVMKDMVVGDTRGGHTHHKTRQILFALNGSCVVDMEDARGTSSVRLDIFNKGILLAPYVWHVMRDFAPGTILLVLADTEYDERDYIRDYNEFKKIIVSL